MTDPLIIPQSHTPALRLFHLDPTDPQARILAEAPTQAIIAASLGLPNIPPGSAEVVRLADISALGLRDFLVKAHDVTPEAVDPEDTLDALDGHVLIVHPSIARNGAVTLHPGPGLHLLGAFATATPAPTPLHVPEPERPFAPGQTPIPTPAQRSGGGTVLLLLVLVVAVIVLGVLGVPLWPW